MTSALFEGLAKLAVSVFSEEVNYVLTNTVLSAKVRKDFVAVDGSDTYEEVTFLHFSEDDLSELDVTLNIDDILIVRGGTYKILDTSNTGRGMLQARLGEVI